MRAKKLWTVQSLITCFFWNAAMVAVFFYLAQRALAGLHLWVDPVMGVGAGDLPENLRSAFRSMSELIDQMRLYLIPVLCGVGGVITLTLWLFVLFQGRGLANRAQREVSAAPAEEERMREKKARQKAPEIPPEPAFVQASPQAAVQMLVVLQREGRLIDFLEEDLTQYDDAQIGAAVRSIHQGCKQAMNDYVELNPIFEEEEGTEVSVSPGFDSRAIRLTGSIIGDPPFRGVLRHRGWRVAKVQLPQTTSEQEKDWVLAPAEVEIEGQNSGPEGQEPE